MTQNLNDRDMNNQEELILEILSSVNVVKGKTKFVKILHLTCKLLEKNHKKSPFSFRSDDYGIYTTELEPVLQNLEGEGYIKMQKSFFSKRVDLVSMNKPHETLDADILEMSSKIKFMVQILNSYSAEDIVACSYSLFPDTAINSKIKPKINKKITELFSQLSTDFEESIEEVVEKPSSTNNMTLYPQFNDLDVRMHMMKSLELKELPPIIPSIIDESTGLLAKKHPFFKKYNLEEMLENARRG